MTTFNNTPTVVVGIVPCGRGLLMIRRALADGKGKLALPGGYQVRPDSLKQTLIREVKEETGVELNQFCMNVVHAETVPDGSVNLVFFKHQWIHPPAAFTHDHEVEEVLVITEPVETAFPIHTRIVRAFFAGNC